MADKSVKEMVLNSLAEEDGLTLSELHRKIVSSYRSRHTIQGTKKALLSLLKEKKIERSGLKYFISMDWLTKQKAFVDRIIAEKTRKKYVDIDYTADYNLLSFENLFELDNFWGGLILKLAARSKEKKWFAIDNFLWFFIINLGYETSFVAGLKKLGFKCFLGTSKGFPLNQWGLKVYRAMGVKTFALERKAIAKGTDINVIGDKIVEVTFDSKVFKRIESIFKRFKRIEDIPLKTIAELSTMKGRHEMKIIHSPALAEKIKREFKSAQR